MAHPADTTLARTGLTGLGIYPLPRRGMLMTGLIGGFTLATTRVDAQAIHTPADGLVAGFHLRFRGDFPHRPQRRAEREPRDHQRRAG